MSAKIGELVNLGFTQQEAMDALKQFNWNETAALNHLLTQPHDQELDKASTLYSVSQSLQIRPEDEQMAQAIQRSLEDQVQPEFFSFEPLPAEQRQREAGIPVGIKNVGNTCYFNSLLQTYFMIPKFVQEVLTFHCAEGTEGSKSTNLVEQLQKLFTSLIRSNQKYVDPLNVLHALVDDYGNHIQIGDQKDVGEFNMILVARIEEGLKGKRSEEELLIQLSGTQLNLAEQGIISNLFYGKQWELICAVEEDQSPVQLTNSGVFGQILVDVDDKDLYTAWDSASFSTIEDFATPQGATTAATQEI